MTLSPLQQIQDYHQSSKHHPDRYAPGPGGLDWRTQPDPFRVFEGVPVVDLPFQADRCATPFAAVRAGQRPAPAPLALEHLGALLELSFGLSAWKSVGDARWALRCNPSSGNLHPTECYLISAGCPGLAGGLYHYRSLDHCLEHRAEDLVSEPAAAPDGIVLALSSIHWREAWKYGLRAYRYCQLDLGHALGAVAYAAATLGWQVARLDWSDAELTRVLGLDRASEFVAEEPECADLALWVGAGAPRRELIEGLRDRPRRFLGRAKRLSSGYRDWPGIAEAHLACARPALAPPAATRAVLPPLQPHACPDRAADLVRRRRSAVAYDGHTHLDAERWFGLLDALLPRAAVPPWDLWPRRVGVAPLLFVHRVAGVAPGLYLMARAADTLGELRQSLRRAWLWEPLAAAPPHLGLYRLAEGDVRGAARMLSCHQDIAADGCCAVAMLARFDASLAEGAWNYRDLFWECGLLGQILYLEAEALGLRGTGIGCFFDDALHELLGIHDSRWQSLYHFTLGGPLEDARLQTAPPYDHRRPDATHAGS